MIWKGLQWLICRDLRHSKALVPPTPDSGGFDHNVCFIMASGTYVGASAVVPSTVQKVCV